LGYFFIFGQLLICLMNVLGGTRLFKNAAYFKNEIRYIYLFCVLDFLTSAVGALIFFEDERFFPVMTYAYITFIWSEITLLPAYINSVMQRKHNWFLPISVVLITFFLSFKYVSIVDSFLQLFSGVYITIFCFKYLKWLFSINDTFNLLKTNHFWIVIGIMFCYTASLPSCITAFIFGIFGNSPEHKRMEYLMTPIYMLLNMTMHCFFIKAFKWTEELQ
jgi:hypothetical protein